MKKSQMSFSNAAMVCQGQREHRKKKKRKYWKTKKWEKNKCLIKTKEGRRRMVVCNKEGIAIDDEEEEEKICLGFSQIFIKLSLDT